MRRLPVYFILDVSESMVGEPIQQVQEGMRMIIQDLRSDPYALETVFVSIIAFAGKAHVLSPLEELYKFYPPELPVGDGTSLGEALNCLMSDMDKSVQKTTMEVKGDWKPIIFLFTDGVPTDDTSKAIEKWNGMYRKHCNLIAVSIGDGVDTYVLGQMTDNVLRLKGTGKDAFKEFFKWVTASIKTSSVSISNYSDDDVKLAPADGINLEKVDPHEHFMVDENYVVLHGKCTSTGKSYLVKYGRCSQGRDEDRPVDNAVFNLIGSYAISSENYEKFSGDNVVSETIKSDKMFGLPTCPCCGNQFGVIVCGSCSNISCWSGKKMHKCPWCGSQGEVGQSSEAFDLVRERG